MTVTEQRVFVPARPMAVRLLARGVPFFAPWDGRPTDRRLAVDELERFCQTAAMQLHVRNALVVPTLATFLFALGCGTESNDTTQYGAVDSGPDGSAGSGGSGGGSGGSAGNQDAGDGSVLDVNTPDGDTPDVEVTVYAHDRETLYTVDPEDPQLSVKQVGKFDCIGDNGEPSMTDIAVDRDGKLYGVSSRALFLDMEIDGSIVRCTSGKVEIDEGTLGSDARFYGLTFAPPTSKLGNEETLIGANTVGDLYMINRTTGELTPVGRFGKVPSDDGRGHDYPVDNVGQNWALSGDMVFLMNEGSPVGFATLRDCPDPSQAPSGCSTVDTLVEIDVGMLAPTTSGAVPIVTKEIRGQILPNGCNDASCGYGSIYGIAAFDDKVFGFVYKRGENQDPPSGMLISIDNDTGAAQLISSPLTGDGFAGAGVTTLAPVIPPPPK